MKHSSLEETAKALVAEGKGILAADETVGTITKRFESLKISSTEESRRTYREMLFTGPGVSEFISGVIMYDETIRQGDEEIHLSSKAPLAIRPIVTWQPS
jgi:fructose-bisphosphate aldolase class I